MTHSKRNRPPFLKPINPPGINPCSKPAGNKTCFDDARPPKKVNAQYTTHAYAPFELFTRSKVHHLLSELEFCRPKAAQRRATERFVRSLADDEGFCLPPPRFLGEVLRHKHWSDRNSCFHPTDVQAFTWWRCNQ